MLYKQIGNSKSVIAISTVTALAKIFKVKNRRKISIAKSNQTLLQLFL